MPPPPLSWPQTPTQPKSAVQQNLQVDWKRWKPEFDDNTNDEDEDQMMPGAALRRGGVGGATDQPVV